MIGRRDSTVITGTLASIQAHNLPHQVLSAEDVSARWPVFQPAVDEIGVYEETAGYLVPENCIAAHLDRAEANGADLRFEEKMVSWSAVDGREGEARLYRITTSKGSYLTKKLILSVGAWAPEIYGGLLLGQGEERRVKGDPSLSPSSSSLSTGASLSTASTSPLELHVERRVMYWLEPQQQNSTAALHGDGDGFGDIPIYIWDLGKSSGAFYGFPREKTDKNNRSDTIGVKVAIHVNGDGNDRVSGSVSAEGAAGPGPGQVVCTPETIDRSVSDAEITQVSYNIRWNSMWTHREHCIRSHVHHYVE
jgi:FAD dependent oxidoreductase